MAETPRAEGAEAERSERPGTGRAGEAGPAGPAGRGRRGEVGARAGREAAAREGEERGRQGAWRRGLRAIHRDVGYVAVGLTVIYAVSGLAVNHVADWDPNFANHSVVHELGPMEAEKAPELVLARLGIGERPKEVYRAAPDRIDVVLGRRTLHIDPQRGRVVDEGQRPRVFLRLANWLHLNRGKKAWTYAADAYAAGLLVLAVSGVFMLPGRRGLLGRGGVLVLVGIAIPLLYVTLSGGP